MKIIYAADVHGDFKSLEKFRDYAKDNADYVVCSGDLLGFTLKENQMQQLGGLTQALLTLRKANGIKESLEDMTEKLLGMDEVQDEIKQAAQRYQRLQNLVKAKAKKQYQNIKEIFDSFNTTVYTIPGNWDIKHFCDTSLLQNSLHEKKIPELNGVTFGGYGGSGQMMTGILPRDLQIPYHEDEVYDFLCKCHDKDSDLDIVVVHLPPQRILDRAFKDVVMEKEDGSKQEVRLIKYAGSWPLRSYISEEQPYLLLVGHMHEDIGVENYFKTTVINPGNLGINPIGSDEKYGTFMEILTEDKEPRFKEAKLRNIEDPNKVILNYVLTDKGIKKNKIKECEENGA